MSGDSFLVDHALVGQMATHLKKEEAELRTRLGDIKSRVDELVTTGFKTPQASESFRQFQSEWNVTATNTITVLDEMGRYLEKLSQAATEVDTSFRVG